MKILEDGNIYELDTVSGKTTKISFFKKHNGVLCRDGVSVIEVLDCAGDRLHKLGHIDASIAIENVVASLQQEGAEAFAGIDDSKINKYMADTTETEVEYERELVECFKNSAFFEPASIKGGTES